MEWKDVEQFGILKIKKLFEGALLFVLGNDGHQLHIQNEEICLL